MQSKIEKRLNKWLDKEFLPPLDELLESRLLKEEFSTSLIHSEAILNDLVFCTDTFKTTVKGKAILGEFIRTVIEKWIKKIARSIFKGEKITHEEFLKRAKSIVEYLVRKNVFSEAEIKGRAEVVRILYPTFIFVMVVYIHDKVEEL